MKKCHYCAEEIQDEAIVCRYCGRNLVEEPKESTSPIAIQDPKSVKRSTTRGLLLILVVLAAILIFGTLLSKPAENKPKVDGDTGFYMCQSFVEKRLKAPTTAKFGSLSESEVVKVSEGQYKVTSFVDSQNSFGAMIRTNYACTVSWQGGDTWKLENLQTD